MKGMFQQNLQFSIYIAKVKQKPFKCSNNEAQRYVII